MANNIFIKILSSIDIKYTKSYANEIYLDQPYRNTFYGICQLLDRYLISNKVVRYTDKNLISPEMDLPLLVKYNDSFVLITRIDSESYNIKNSSGREKKIDKEKFINNWDGYAIEFKTTPYSIEPDYLMHCKTNAHQTVQKVVLIVCSLLFLLMYFMNGISLPFLSKIIWL